jgi:hypothetical protein
MSKEIIDTLNRVWKEAYPDATDAELRRRLPLLR